MPVPTRRLALLALVLALPVLFVPGGVIPVLVAVNAVLVALAGADWARAVHPEALTLERDLPAVVTLGTEAEVVWRLRNPTRRGVVVSLADELAPSLGAGSRRADGTLLTPGWLRALTWGNR